MSKRSKIIVSLLLCCTLLFGTGFAAKVTAYISDMTLFVNGQKIDQDVIIIDGTSYLPVRAIGNAIGAKVGFDNKTRRIDLNLAKEEPKQPEEPEKPEQPPAGVKTYAAGMYKIGSDMPAGEYVLLGSDMAYFQIAKDSTGLLNSVIANDIFVNRSIITVEDGQYLTMKNCKAVAFDEAPKVQLVDGCLPAGTYKIGVDLPAGEYKLIPAGMGYVEVSTNSLHTLESIITNDMFESEQYITVKDGQYIKVSDAKIVVK